MKFLLHISEIAWERTENVSDVLKIGDVFDVKYFGIDKKTRKEKVSRKVLIEKPKGYDDKRRNFREKSEKKNFFETFFVLFRITIVKV